MKRGFLLLAAGMLLTTATTFPEPDPAAAVSLGRQLFFDPILSGPQTISCASCHREAFAFADTTAFSIGVYGRHTRRNTPSVMNVLMQEKIFWDGRAATLEEQALAPISNADEMDLPVAVAVKRLNQSPTYRAAFGRVFGQAPSSRTLALALAAFERSLETNNSPLDDWRRNDNEQALSESAKRGYALFSGKAGCQRCHFGPDFNSAEFRNIGLYDGQTLADSGRAGITRQAADLGRFKIGSLRNIAITAPYMHNGMFRTLAQVIDYYDNPDQVVPNPRNRDPFLAQPLHLTPQEKQDLVGFLEALTDKRFAAVRRPTASKRR